MKTVIAVPCMDMMDTVFVQSLVNLEPVGTITHAFQMGSLVYASRNDLSVLARDLQSDFVLWLDSDMVFPPELLKNMMARMNECDMLTGVCHMRRPPYQPCLYSKLRLGMRPEENESEAYVDYPKDKVFEVEGCGMACALMKTELIGKVIDRYHEAFSPLAGYGEDLSFCIRARACGGVIKCDPRIQIGHRATTIVTNETFEAYRRAQRCGS